MKGLDAYQDAILKLTSGNCKDSSDVEVALEKLKERNKNACGNHVSVILRSA